MFTSEYTLICLTTMMAYGVGIAVLVLVITGISYALTPDGGTYFVFTGMIIGGILYFIIGFFKMLAGR